MGPRDGRAPPEQEVPLLHRNRGEHSAFLQAGSRAPVINGLQQGAPGPSPLRSQAFPVGEAADDDDDDDGADSDLESLQGAGRGCCAAGLDFAALFLSLGTIAGGIYLAAQAGDLEVLHLAVWRWCVFFGAMLPLRHLSELVVTLAVRTVESKYFLEGRLMFFLTPIKPPLSTLVQSASYTLLWACIVTADAAKGITLLHRSHVVLRGLACVNIFCAGRVAAQLLTKSFASRFNRAAFFDRLQQSLEKEFFLSTLTVPRVRPKRAKQSAPLLRRRAAPPANAPPQLNMGGPRVFGHRPSGSGTGKGAPAMRVASSSAAEAELPSPAHAPPGPRDSPRSGRGSPRASSTGRPATPDPQRPARFDPTAPPDAGSSDEEDRQRQLEEACGRSGHDTNAAGGSSGAPGPGVAAASAGAADPAGMRRVDSFASSGVPEGPLGSGDLGLEDGIVRDKNELLNQMRDFMHLRKEEVTGTQASRLERYVRRHHFGVTFSHKLKTTGALQDPQSMERVSRRLARWVWQNVRESRGQDEITRSDLEYFLPSDKVEKCIAMLDATRDGRISRADVRTTVRSIVTERHDLNKTIHDSNTAVGRMGVLIQAVINLCVFFASMVVFEIDIVSLWLSTASVLLALGVVFGNTLKNIFESSLLLFSTHPFDVGDACLIDGEWYVIREISLLRTTMEHELGSLCSFPNHKLNDLPVHNLSRSPNKWDSFTAYIDLASCTAACEALDRDLQELARSRPDYFPGDVRVRVFTPTGPERGFKAQVSVWYEMGNDGSDLKLVGLIRNTMHMACMQSLSRNGVRFAHRHEMTAAWGATQFEDGTMWQAPARQAGVKGGAEPPAPKAAAAVAERPRQFQ
ncbi:unnamed protein product [Pedinophyceae sp. YPF-701]|nr:unnamed protein product [Pedinophyceae sp. YPF-701]